MIRRRLTIEYEINDGDEVFRARKMILGEVLEEARKDVRGAILWHFAEWAIRDAEQAWETLQEAAAADG